MNAALGFLLDFVFLAAFRRAGFLAAFFAVFFLAFFFAAIVFSLGEVAFDLLSLWDQRCFATPRYNIASLPPIGKQGFFPLETRFLPSGGPGWWSDFPRDIVCFSSGKRLSLPAFQRRKACLSD
jgi:hypothetical protein